MNITSKNENAMDKNDIPLAELDYLMRMSYESLMINKSRTLTSFIIFDEGDNIIEVDKHIGQRSKVIDILIEFFVKFEEYEKCEELIKLRTLIVKYGD